MITHPKTNADRNRQRLLAGFLLRFARVPLAHQYILRGGMLLRQWLHPLPRMADDLDFVCTRPFDVEEVARPLLSVLSDSNADDGVTFDVQRVRVEGIWLKSAFPGVRIYAAGHVGGQSVVFHIDTAFNEPLIPAPQYGDYRICDDQSVPLWMCRPETIIARKLHSLWYNGMRGWRPKDLNDIQLILRSVATDNGDLAAAIAASFASRGDTSREARLLFDADHAWWKTKTAAARWCDFAARTKIATSDSVVEVVAEVSRCLQSALDPMP